MKYWLKVWFNVVIGNHSGDCFNPEHIEYNHYDETDIFEMPENLPPDAIDENGCVNSDYLSHMSSEWVHGTGYCGVVSSRIVKSCAIMWHTDTKTTELIEDNDLMSDLED